MKDIMLVYNNINNVFGIVKRSADRIAGAKVVNEDINTFQIDMEFNSGMFSKNELVTINLEKINDLQTKIIFDDHSQKGVVAEKNKNIENLKMIIDSLMPKIKVPEGMAKQEEDNQVAVHEPSMDNMNKQGYNDQYDNEVYYDNQGNMMNNYQPMDNQYQDYQGMNNDYQNMPMDNGYYNDGQYYQQDYQQDQYAYQQDQSFQNYNDFPQETQNFGQPQYDQNGEVSQMESDPVNDLMMGNFDSKEPSQVTNVPSQSSEKMNSDPLRDFMNNMSA